MGHPQVALETMFQLIRQNDTDYSTTVNLSDEKLKDLVANSIQNSKKLENQCKNLNIPFFDTSINRNEKLLEILQYIKQNIS